MVFLSLSLSLLYSLLNQIRRGVLVLLEKEDIRGVIMTLGERDRKVEQQKKQQNDGANLKKKVFQIENMVYRFAKSSKSI